MPITQTDINLVTSNNIHGHVKFNVYDSEDTLIDELTGFATSFTWNNVSDSDIRRTATVTMYVPDKSYLVESHTVIWLDNKIKVHIGLENTSGTITWYLVGTYLFSDTSYKYDATTQEMTMTLIDVMSCTTEKRGSQINGYGLTIPAGENVRNALISIITNFTPFSQYSIPEFPDTVPYDLEFSIGVYPYEVLKTIIELFPTYEMYYDENGIFTVAEIPTGIGDDVFLDETIIEKLIIGETKTSTFANVRNTTELMGRSLNADYTASTCTTVGSSYYLYISDLITVLEDGSLYGFTPDTTSVLGQTIKIQETADIAIYLQGLSVENDTPIAAGAMTANIPYCVKYTNSRFYLQGELEIHVIVKEVNVEPSDLEKEAYKEAMQCRDVMWIVNPDSPFAADRISEIRQVLSDGEYSDIYTTQLAFERAAYENWKTTRLQDSVTITMGLIPWLDVNKKIGYRSPLIGKLINGNFTINDDGILVLDNQVEFNPYYFNVLNGSLQYYVNDYSNIYINTTFELNDAGELIMTTSDSVVYLMIKSINFNLAEFTMDVEAIYYYPYMPF